ncbi:MAG TPA: hypothetical protein VIS48_03730 [Candidatus Kryptonia bacterium]
MADYVITSDFLRIFETVKISFVLTDSEMNLLYANRYARETLPLNLKLGKKLDVESFLQNEDSMAFESLINECRKQGESTGIFKQRQADKYYKVKAYSLRNKEEEIVFHFEDVSQSRILENQLYEHLLDLYSQLEMREREIANLRAGMLRTRETSSGF